MQVEADRVWQKVVATASFLDGSRTDEAHGFLRRFIVGKFSASISTVENSSDPVLMDASVGWADSSAYQSYDFDETFRSPITVRFMSSEDHWVEPASGESYSDEEIVDWLLKTLGVWVKTEGRFEPDEEYW